MTSNDNPNAGQKLYVQVHAVTDGGSLLVTHVAAKRKLTVQLYGINIPARPQVCDAEAVKYLSRLALNKQFISEFIKLEGHSDRVKCVLRGPGHKQSLNLKMIAAGLAYSSTDLEELPGAKEAEKQARQKGLGIWREGNPQMQSKSRPQTNRQSPVSEPQSQKSNTLSSVPRQWQQTSVNPSEAIDPPEPSKIIETNRQSLKGGQLFQVKVVQVKDGDSLVVRNTKTGRDLEIRLHGIDAPEYAQGNGISAWIHLSDMALNEYFMMEVTDPKDFYGRVVGILHHRDSEKSVNLQMVADGWAYNYADFGELEGAEEAENTDRQKGLGVWQEGDLEMRPWAYRRINRGQAARRQQVPHQDAPPLRRKAPSLVSPYPQPPSINRPPTKQVGSHQRDPARASQVVKSEEDPNDRKCQPSGVWDRIESIISVCILGLLLITYFPYLMCRTIVGDIYRHFICPLAANRGFGKVPLKVPHISWGAALFLVWMTLIILVTIGRSLG